MLYFSIDVNSNRSRTSSNYFAYSIKHEFIKTKHLSIMNKILSLPIMALLLFFAACSGGSEESAVIVMEQQEVEMVTDSVSIEMEELREDIEQTMDELDSLLEEID